MVIEDVKISEIQALILVITLMTFLVVKYIIPKRIRRDSIAFFHLYCSSGGGGERVLWFAIDALITEYREKCPKIYIYSHYDTPKDKYYILKKVKDQFKIDIISKEEQYGKIVFIPLRSSFLVEAKRYPFLTLLFQSIGSIIVACEAAFYLVPELYIESIGMTFTLPVFKLHSCRVITYVHYPIISNDMIKDVETSTHASFNNREIFTRSPLLRRAKLLYYRIFAFMYALAGSQADAVLVNSSWTKKHIDSLWNIRSKVVYPPCDVDSFKKLYEQRAPKKTCNVSKSLKIISVAQFRPEKNHISQIDAFDKFIKMSGAQESSLTLYGGCRDNEDEKRVNELREHISKLDLESHVNIVVNAPFDQLLDGMRDADVAIHTMENEHFGIVLVEFMAAGLITICHNSGGPKEDIIDFYDNGYLASTTGEFAQHLEYVSELPDWRRQHISDQAVIKAEKFSNQVFARKFIEYMIDCMQMRDR